jgi:hypothetical protein
LLQKQQSQQAQQSQQSQQQLTQKSRHVLLEIALESEIKLQQQLKKAADAHIRNLQKAVEKVPEEHHANCRKLEIDFTARQQQIKRAREEEESKIVSEFNRKQSMMEKEYKNKSIELEKNVVAKQKKLAIEITSVQKSRDITVSQCTMIAKQLKNILDAAASSSSTSSSFIPKTSILDEEFDLKSTQSLLRGGAGRQPKLNRPDKTLINAVGAGGGVSAGGGGVNSGHEVEGSVSLGHFPRHSMTTPTVAQQTDFPFNSNNNNNNNIYPYPHQSYPSIPGGQMVQVGSQHHPSSTSLPPANFGSLGFQPQMGANGRLFGPDQNNMKTSGVGMMTQMGVVGGVVGTGGGGGGGGGAPPQHFYCRDVAFETWVETVLKMSPEDVVRNSIPKLCLDLRSSGIFPSFEEVNRWGVRCVDDII